MSYKQLSLEERHYIEIEIKKGTFRSDIVEALGRNQRIIGVRVELIVLPPAKHQGVQS
jgi:hypothetical protein